MATTKNAYKSVSTHVEDLSDGRSVAPGDSITLTAEELKDPHNARLIDEGVFIVVEETKEDKTEKGGSN